MADFTFSNLKTLEQASEDLAGSTIEGKRTDKGEIQGRILEEKSTLRRKTELGRGGMGVIYSVEQRTLGRNIVVKELRPELAQKEEHRTKFLEEAIITGLLEVNPNIPPTHSLDEKNCRWSMKEIKGENLEKILEEPYELREIIRKILPIFDSLSYAHSLGIIHRDLKPENIMIGAFGEPYLMDWGIAQINKAENQPVALKKIIAKRKKEDGEFAGTPAYMAPEQADALVSRIDERTDIYTMGCIIYRIATGRLPIEAQGLYPLLAKKLNPKTKIIPPEDKELAAICAKAMAFEQEERYQNVEELKQDLLNYLNNKKVSVCEYGRLELMVKWVQNNAQKTMGVIAAGGIASGLVIAGITGIAAYNSSQAAKSIAEAEKIRAEQSELARKLAEKEKETAVIAKRNAEQEKERATLDKRLAEKEKETAEIAKKLAEQEKEKAGLEKKLAEQERDVAKQEVEGQQKSQAILESLRFLRKDEGYYGAAIALINRAIDSSKGYWRPYLILAKHHASFDKQNEADEFFQKANEVYKAQFGVYSPEIWFEGGIRYGIQMDFLGGQGENNNALEYFSNAYVAGPNTTFGKLAKAMELVMNANRDLDKVDTYVPEAIRISNELIDDNVAKGVSATYLVRAWIFGITAFDAYSNNAMLKKYENLPEAKKSLEHIIGEYEDSPWVMNFLAQIHMAVRSYDEAIKVYSTIINARKDAYLYNGRGLAYFRKKDYRAAITDFSRAIELEPKKARYYYNRGHSYFELDDLENSIVDNKKTIELDEKYASAYNNLGIIYWKQGKINLSRQNLARSVELDSRNEVGWCYLGHIGNEEKKWAEAAEFFSRALEIYPDYYEARCARGRAYLEVSRFDEAISDYDYAIRQNPADSVCYTNRGNGYKGKKMIKEAVQDYKEALRLKPGSWIPLYNWGCATKDKKILQEALKYAPESRREMIIKEIKGLEGGK